MKQTSKIQLILTLTLIWYVLGAFVGATMDFAKWEIGGRVVWVLGWLIMTFSTQFHDKE